MSDPVRLMLRGRVLEFEPDQLWRLTDELVDADGEIGNALATASDLRLAAKTLAGGAEIELSDAQATAVEALLQQRHASAVDALASARPPYPVPVSEQGDEQEMSTRQTNIWTYRDQSWSTGNLVGYSVEALDGGIGKIDEDSNDVSASYLVVDTGPWIFGKKVMLPAGVISRVDHDDEKVFVNRTKDQIKAAPEFDDNLYEDDAYRSRLGGYYDQGGPGWRDW